MKFKQIFKLLPVYLVFQAGVVQADDIVKEKISKTLNSVFPEVEITRVTNSKVPGVYEVMLGAEVIYMSQDGRYVFKGDLIDLGERRNLSEEQRAIARVDILNKIPASEMIEFAPEKTEHAVYVFTDVDCGYCRRLHRDVPQLNRLGVAVRYLAFPRAGEGSKSFKQMEAVWCANDRNKALTEAKLGKTVKSETCKNPVAKQFALGQDMGVRGTPAIFLEDGRELPGYLPPNKLVQAVRGK